MTYPDKLKDQVEALAGVLACAVSLVEDIRQELGGETGTGNVPHPTGEAIYVMGRLAGLITRQAQRSLKEATHG